MPGPSAEEYARRLAVREAQVAVFERQHFHIGNLRLLLVVTSVAAAWWSISRQAFSWPWLLIPAGLLVVLGLYHSRVLRRRALAERAVAFYCKGLARTGDEWAGKGQGGERFDVPHHVYASDLDIFGKGSLFELLSISRTRMGEETLAQWLLSPAPVAEVLERQRAVSELRDQLDLREDLALLGERPGVGVQSAALLKWAAAPNRLPQKWMPRLAPIFPFLAVGAAVAWGIWGLATPFLLIVLTEWALSFLLRKHIQEVFKTAESAFQDLDLLSGVLARLERGPFQSPHLRRLTTDLQSHSLAGSKAIARLRTIVQYVESRRNPIFRLIDIPLLYSVQVAFAAERWRGRHGIAVPQWLKVTGEIEALVSLAAYSYEHPADPFPEFVQGPASFQAEELGHPLVPDAKCVRNSLSIGGNARVLLVSGSNMSGKSTLLRSVGVNVVLAMAGAPVRAGRLRLTPLQVGASIRINDSLHEGNSRFYAEITRLRQIHALAGADPPLLFLLDELLQGTNSNDRRIGAEGVVRALVEKGSIGLISTHDLALTNIGGFEEGTLHNVHFQDDLENGRMTFDFKLREGVVTKSNGLELMRSIGLKV